MFSEAWALGINEAAVIPTPGHKEWLLLSPLLTASLRWGKGPPWQRGLESGGEMSPLLYSRADHGMPERARPMAGPCPPAALPTSRRAPRPPARLVWLWGRGSRGTQKTSAVGWKPQTCC